MTTHAPKKPCFNNSLNGTFQPFPVSFIANLRPDGTNEKFDLALPLDLKANVYYRVVLKLNNPVTMDHLYVLFVNMNPTPLAEVMSHPMHPMASAPETASALIFEDERQDESISVIRYTFLVKKSFKLRLDVRGCVQSKRLSAYCCYWNTG